MTAIAIDLEKKKDISYATLKNWQRLGVDNIGHKLVSRANKRFSEKKITPEEYIQNNSVIETARYFQKEGFSIAEILFSIVLGLTKDTKNKYLFHELESWNIPNNRIVPSLSNYTSNHKGDILGGIYQSLLNEGQKNTQGLYYTPKYIIKDIIDKHFLDGMKFIDPCCGSGQFLLQIPSQDPENIWGADIDEIAVKIARINLMIKYSGVDFLPNVFCTDSLQKENSLFEKNILPSDYFDLVATNPPWGSKLDTIHSGYSVKSGESFSFFIERGMDLLKKGGILSYILPESILYVKTHEDVRKVLLDFDIVSITELGRIFTGVFTPAIQLDVKKQSEDGNIEIYSREKYTIKKSLFIKNPHYTFSIHIDEKNSDLLNKIYSKKALYLTNENTDWALGIVTGNNKEFISHEKKDGYIPIYTGKEVGPYFLKESKQFLLYEPERYQQKAPMERYETSPKLIYKFISNKLVFSLDEIGVFTLNSANIVIPRIDYSLKVIIALFNSELYQTIFQKKFHSIKVLKSHIQELPLPILEANDICHIEKMVDTMIFTKNISQKGELDACIFNLLTQ